MFPCKCTCVHVLSIVFSNTEHSRHETSVYAKINDSRVAGAHTADGKRAWAAPIQTHVDVEAERVMHTERMGQWGRYTVVCSYVWVHVHTQFHSSCGCVNLNKLKERRCEGAADFAVVGWIPLILCVVDVECRCLLPVVSRSVGPCRRQHVVTILEAAWQVVVLKVRAWV